MDALYSFAEQDDAKQEVAAARKEMAQRQVEESKRQAEEKMNKEKEDLEREIKELQRKAHQGEGLQKKGQMAIQMGGEVHYVDMPEDGAELVSLDAEPKVESAASLDSGAEFIDEATRASATEVEMAKKQAIINEQNRQQAMLAAKRQAQLAALDGERKQERIMADGLIHRKDGTRVDPVTQQVVDGANSFAQLN